ncbi:MAG TPA: SEC-C metal-binding domain-containing protein [Myxococcota bacterium]|nr:SEC-C metal-binding domain-containing protein [Myxococcota bacterium]HRY92429.1 SEC-C metal-binding domain-containing protein [Myxococcota bacterium]HSA22766.1 SEC-C metal-binding domain-containing protein [Myxococcota bacterium]
MPEAQDKLGRNEPCPCGSGKKYKHCCLHQESSQPTRRFKGVMVVLAVLSVLASVAGALLLREWWVLAGGGMLAALLLVLENPPAARKPVRVRGR